MEFIIYFGVILLIIAIAAYKWGCEEREWVQTKTDPDGYFYEYIGRPTGIAHSLFNANDNINFPITVFALIIWPLAFPIISIVGTVYLVIKYLLIPMFTFIANIGYKHGCKIKTMKTTVSNIK